MRLSRMAEAMEREAESGSLTILTQMLEPFREEAAGLKDLLSSGVT